MGGSHRPSPPPPPPPPPSRETPDPEVERRTKEQMRALRRRKGRQSTILTSPGLGDVAAPVEQKKLLG